MTITLTIGRYRRTKSIQLCCTNDHQSSSISGMSSSVVAESPCGFCMHEACRLFGKLWAVAEEISPCIDERLLVEPSP